MEDIFSQFGDIFGGSPFGDIGGVTKRGRSKGPDIRIKLALDYEEINKGEKDQRKRSVVADEFNH